MPEAVASGLVLVLSAVVIGAAVAAVSSRRPGHAAMWLATATLPLAVIAIMLRAEYVAAVTLVLGGAVAALVLATGTVPGSPRTRDSASLWAIAAAVLAVAAVGAAIAVVAPSVRAAAASTTPLGVAELGSALFTRWPVPVALVASALLSVLIGAASGSRGDDE